MDTDGHEVESARRAAGRPRGTRRPAGRVDEPSTTPLPSVVRFSAERRAEIAGALRRGTLVRARQGIYVSTPSASTQPAQRRRQTVVIQAVALAERLTTDYWFSHSTAAVLHGLWTWRLSDEVHVTQLGNPSVRRRTDPGVRRHWTALPEADRGKADGLPVTSLERTIVDCARYLTPTAGIVVADSGIRAGADLGRVAQILEAAAGGRGVRRARQVLAEADGRSESPGESAVRWIAIDGGLPRPEPNHVVSTWRGEYRLDLAWTQQQVAVEFDGAVKYSGGEYGDPQARLLAEKARHDALVEAGWLVLRVTWGDLADPDLLVRRIRTALVRRAAR